MRGVIKKKKILGSLLRGTVMKMGWKNTGLGYRAYEEEIRLRPNYDDEAKESGLQV